MQKTRPAYAAEFRNQIIKLARAGRSVEDLAREFEPSGHTIRKWLRDAGIYDAGGGSVRPQTVSSFARPFVERTLHHYGEVLGAQVSARSERHQLSDIALYGGIAGSI